MNPKQKKIITIAIIILGVFSWIYVALDIYRLENNQNFPWQNYYKQPVLISDISSWMTFDYINKVFNLPPAYLKEKLLVNDTRYPLLTLRQYSRRTKISTNGFIINLQNAVKAYLTPSTP